jgi:hypothetical protein
MLGVLAGLREVGIKLLGEGVLPAMSELSIQAGVSRLVTIVLLHGAFTAILVFFSFVTHCASGPSGSTKFANAFNDARAISSG